MEIVKTFIKRHENRTAEEDREIPESKVWIQEIDTLYASFLSLSSLFTAVVACLAVLQLYHVYKYVSNTRIQADLYYLVLMFPITTVCNMAGMYIPRAAPFLYAVALVWFMFAQLFGLISMCIAFYGCYVIVPLGKTKITPYRFSTLFTIVDVAQCLYTIQKFCFDFAAAFEFIEPDRLLTTAAKAQCSNQTIDSFMTPAVRIEPETKITFDPIVGETLRIRRNSENPVLTL
ncbi:hypothetical protein TELCIR_04623 [Teladorsagia circumcincta]|uniref:Uncharacterized protein n=1 Tax=Teladorsagia circumcincta TaxID=45464 RepID=A0A2G9UT29_TELCI|nr:hypothetical protein TELCIR_04623 [Teladorsagia circumcincta]